MAKSKRWEALQEALKDDPLVVTISRRPRLLVRTNPYRHKMGKDLSIARVYIGTERFNLLMDRTVHGREVELASWHWAQARANKHRRRLVGTGNGEYIFVPADSNVFDKYTSGVLMQYNLAQTVKVGESILEAARRGFEEMTQSMKTLTVSSGWAEGAIKEIAESLNGPYGDVIPTARGKARGT